jgi:hypothetical protein
VIAVFDRPATYAVPGELLGLVATAARSGGVVRVDTTDPDEAAVTVRVAHLVVSARWVRDGSGWRWAGGDVDGAGLTYAQTCRVVAPHGSTLGRDGGWRREDPECGASVPAGVEVKPLGAGPNRRGALPELAGVA